MEICILFFISRLKQISYVLREVIFSRPLLACFIPICSVLKEFSLFDSFVKIFCIAPGKFLLINSLKYIVQLDVHFQIKVGLIFGKDRRLSQLVCTFRYNFEKNNYNLN